MLILSGDLTNNGEKESHIDIAEKLKEIEKNGTAVYVIPGNHEGENVSFVITEGAKGPMAENVQKL